jgi:hypothetical protein
MVKAPSCDEGIARLIPAIVVNATIILAMQIE